MDYLYLDYETRSIIDLETRGLDNYSRHKSTVPLLLGYAFNSREINLIEFHRNSLTPEVKAALTDPDVVKVAWNSGFEREITYRCLGIWIPFEQWLDPGIYAKYLSLPGKLDKACRILGVPIELAKMESGKDLIKLFCKPVSMGGEETLFGVTEPWFRDHESHPKEWEQFCDYCKNDVASERYIFEMLHKSFPLPEIERRGWILDQKINRRGIPTNISFARNAFEMAETEKVVLKDKLKSLTFLENPNSNVQMLEWLKKEGYPFLSLGKDLVNAALAGTEISFLARQVLEIRKESKKTSYKKLEALLNIVCEEDGFLRYQYNYMGAARTHRWAGWDVQLQNLPSPVTQDLAKYLDDAVDMVARKDADAIRKKFGSIINCVTSVIRACFQPPNGQILDVCDFNAVENRVLGWMAGCRAILEVFEQRLDPYLAFAARMYGIDYRVLEMEYKAGSKSAKEKRQVAKPAVLGCGYGLGAGVIFNRKTGKYEAIIITDDYGNKVKTGLLGYAEKMGVKLTPEQAFLAHKAFRDAYPEVVELWDELDDAVRTVIKKGGKVVVGGKDGRPELVFDRKRRQDGKYILRATPPSGSSLHYINARIEEHPKKDRETGQIVYDSRTNQPKTESIIFYDGIGHGVGAVDKKLQWGPVKTYGGKMCENLDQKISRDVLLHAMLLADSKSLEIVGHSHDEPITMRDDVPWDDRNEILKECLETVPIWAKGLPLKAEGFSTVFYRKG